jgi:hypothetical protein
MAQPSWDVFSSHLSTWKINGDEFHPVKINQAGSGVFMCSARRNLWADGRNARACGPLKHFWTGSAPGWLKLI